MEIFSMTKHTIEFIRVKQFELDFELRVAFSCLETILPKTIKQNLNVLRTDFLVNTFTVLLS